MNRLQRMAELSRRLAWPAFRDTLHDVADFIATQHRIPARVFVGAEAVAPADFLIALASAYHSYRSESHLPVAAGVTLGTHVELLPERHIAADTAKLFGDWIIHAEGFRAPKILEQARLQAWTLKPAIPRP